MSIIQISKIQQRTGNIVDLPQLDEAEFGWASDTKQLFIGKTTPNENIEVLTSYSKINYDQLNGAVGNLNINSVTLEDGQVLTYDGSNWVNRGGDAGGIIDLGTVSNVKITGGAIGYVLETDGLGNLSWTPKSTVIAYIENVTQADPAVVTTTQDNFFTEGQKITITNAQGMTELNGNTFYINVISSNSFSLYSDSGLITPIDSSGYTEYSYSSATDTTASTNRITVGDSALFSLNQEVRFTGDLANSTLENNTSYYIKTKPSSTTITVSEELLANGVAGNVKTLATDTLTGANVYGVGGRVIAAVSSGSGNAAAAGADGSVQYNKSNLIEGDANFVWDYNTNLLTVNGNANVGNLNASSVVSASQYVSNIATGTAPLVVTSTTRVANLNVNRANISDFGSVTNQTTGVFYPVFVTSAVTGNYQLNANANITFNAANGQFSATSLTGNLTTASQPNITSVGTLTGLEVNGNITAANITANTGVFTGNASGLIQINASNLATGTVPTARLSGNYTINVSGSSTTAGTVTTNAQPNITSVGTLTSLIVTANANVGNLYSSGIIKSASNMIVEGGGSEGGQMILGWVGTTGINGQANSTWNMDVDSSNNYRLFYQNATGGVGVAITAYSANANVSMGANLLVTRSVVAGNVYANSGTIGAGNILTPVLTTGANTTAGTITGNWTLTTGSRLQSTYADLAEYYEADDIYEPGTVLMFGGDKEVTVANDGTSKVAGVVSTNPAYVMNSTCPGILTAIALQGRVPCKVRGKISKGDMLISGGNGFARPNQFPTIGTVIGKALEDFDGYEGVIEVAVGRL